MKCRVKKGKKGYINGKRYFEGEEFHIREKEGLKRINNDLKTNKEITLTEEQQFSDKWMERLDEPEPKSEPKKKSRASADTQANM